MIKLIKLIKFIFNSLFSLSIRRYDGVEASLKDIGRDYSDSSLGNTKFPIFLLSKGPSDLGFAEQGTYFEIHNGESLYKELLYYSHLTLLQLCKESEFSNKLSVLDVGSGEGQAKRIFEHLGKKVTTIEVAPALEADYKMDYLDVKLKKKFDIIWCSQILEHQRNPGIFLDKVFFDLKEGGILGLTIPYQVDSHLSFGHGNLYSPLVLIYQLVCSGFNCRDISITTYNGNIGVVLTKKSNGIDTKRSYYSLPVLSDLDNVTERRLSDELFLGMKDSFPIEFDKMNNIKYPDISINWSTLV